MIICIPIDKRNEYCVLLIEFGDCFISDLALDYVGYSVSVYNPASEISIFKLGKSI